MNKKALKSPLKILAATSVTIFSLLSVFTSTAAWFDSQRNLKNGANEMAVTAVNELESLTIYRPTSVSAGQYVFGTDNEHKTVLNVGDALNSSIYLGPDMTPYSPLEPYHPLLCVARYSRDLYVQNDGKVKIKATGAQGYVVPIEGDETSFEILDWNTTQQLFTTKLYDGTQKTVSKLPLSSIVKFYATYYESEDAFLAGGSNTYTYSTAAIHGWHSSQFIDVSGGGADVVASDEAEIYKVESGKVRVIAFVMEYNIDSINNISSRYIGNEFMNEDLPFACDWVLEV